MDFILNLLEFNAKIQYPVIFTFLGVYGLLLWGSLVVYVWRSSMLYSGSSSNFPRGFFILTTVLFGFGGLLIYFLFRGNSIEQERVSRIENGLLQREVWLCPKCSETVMNGEHFCVNCGSVTRKKCESCGSSNQLDSKYCQSCGERFPFVQINDVSIPDHDYMRTLEVRKKLDEFLQTVRLEMKNPRNFKIEPSIASLLKRKYSKSNKTQESVKI